MHLIIKMSHYIDEFSLTSTNEKNNIDESICIREPNAKRNRGRPKKDQEVVNLIVKQKKYVVAQKATERVKAEEIT